MMNGVMKRGRNYGMDNLIPTLFPFSMFDDEFFDDVFNKLSPRSWAGRMKNDYPMNVVRLVDENGRLNGYRLEYALAGFDKDDISLTLKNNVLTLTAEHKDIPTELSDSEKSDVPAIIEKTEYNGISRKKMTMSYTLYDNADVGNIKSRFVNGLLKITIPVKSEEKTDDTRKISIM